MTDAVDDIAATVVAACLRVLRHVCAGALPLCRFFTVRIGLGVGGCWSRLVGTNSPLCSHRRLPCTQALLLRITTGQVPFWLAWLSLWGGAFAQHRWLPLTKGPRWLVALTQQPRVVRCLRLAPLLKWALGGGFAAHAIFATVAVYESQSFPRPAKELGRRVTTIVSNRVWRARVFRAVDWLLFRGVATYVAFEAAKSGWISVFQQPRLTWCEHLGAESLLGVVGIGFTWMLRAYVLLLFSKGSIAHLPAAASAWMRIYSGESS